MLDASEIAYASVFDREGLDWLERGLNASTSLIVLGEVTDPSAPAVGIIHCDPGPGDRLRARHEHESDAINLVIDGAIYMDGVWLRPGQAKIAPADVQYGDGLVGPDGVTFLEIFGTLKGAVPAFADPEDQAYFEEVHGQYMRAEADVEDA